MQNSSLKIGILGGGQLGRMLLQAASSYAVETFVLEAGVESPAVPLAHHFIQGDITDFNTVLNFGKLVDVLTIEIENVNVDALIQLEKEGLKIYPKPSVLQTIKDKGLQKAFYKQHEIPTSDFALLQNCQDILTHSHLIPAAQKLRTGGYDGKGVSIIRSTHDLSQAFDQPSILEKLVNIDKEISVIVARNDRGDTVVYPPTEMLFDPRYHLVDYLISPATINAQQSQQAQELALKLVRAFDSSGLFAVEMFLDQQGKIWVNETAPRAHNSGHQSIEGNYCSQYDMQMRILQNLPLGNTEIIQPSLMLNLIGEPGFSGQVCYQGLDEVLKMKDTYVHLYGKTETKPGRKMGHITLLGSHREELINRAKKLKETIRVIAS